MAQLRDDIETIKLKLASIKEITLLELFLDDYIDKGTKVKFGLDITLCGGSILYTEDYKPPANRQPYKIGMFCDKIDNSMSCHISKTDYLVDNYGDNIIAGGLTFYLNGTFQAAIYRENNKDILVDTYTTETYCNKVTGYFTDVKNAGFYQGFRVISLTAIPVD
ncbi:MAG: hypothetical protein LBF58_05595 [Deltaproteobacteria bacterium]|jgi:hypothetical protein|nr:hypothetical protein [Deltaproteobacteria bacterium]